MGKIITYSNWSAINVPSGISFDTSSGIFSGTPNAEAGEYTIPVSVQTNYGSDSKDVTIVVEEEPHEVFAIGSRAKYWSDDAEPDSYGFRKLPIPKSNKLTSIPCGFAAKVGAGKWYIGSSVSYSNIYGTSDVNYLTPNEFPVNNVQDMTGGITMGADGNIVFTYKTPNLCRQIKAEYNSSTTRYQGVTSADSYDVKKLQENFSHGMAWIKTSGEIYNIATIMYITPIKPVKKVVPNVTSSSNEALFYITQDNELYEHKNGTHTQILPDAGPVENVWTHAISGRIFVSTANHELYARGPNGNFTLGLPELKTYNNFTKVGDFDIKKIELTFMLTKDGKLFHTGKSMLHGITTAHEEFTQIFPEYKFYDIAFLGSDNPFSTKTLVAIKENR